jgi:hypothetical protein
MRRLLSILTPLVAFWALASFAGTMLDPGHAGFWTQSLMWSLIASMVVAPFFVFSRNQTSRSATTAQAARPERSASTEPTDPSDEEPFDDHSKRTLWPKPADAAEEDGGESVAAGA